MLAFLNFRKHQAQSDALLESHHPARRAANRRVINGRDYEQRQHNHYPRQQVLHMAERSDMAKVDRQVDRTMNGRVIWEAVSYPAYCEGDRSFECGTYVRVIKRLGNVLVVTALSSHSSSAGPNANRAHFAS